MFIFFFFENEMSQRKNSSIIKTCLETRQDMEVVDSINYSFSY